MSFEEDNQKLDPGMISDLYVAIDKCRNPQADKNRDIQYFECRDVSANGEKRVLIATKGPILVERQTKDITVTESLFNNLQSSVLQQSFFVRYFKHEKNYDPDIQYVLSEWFDSSLGEIIKKEKTIPTEKALKIYYEILTSIALMSSHNIIHRNIQPRSICINNYYGETNKIQVKITDFGLADVNGESSEILGDEIEYMSPSILTNHSLGKSSVEKYDSCVDCWSATVVFYEMLTGRGPFAALKSKNDYGEILKELSKNAGKNLKFPNGIKISSPIEAFLKETLDLEVSNRLSPDSLMENQIFAAYKRDPQEVKQLTSAFMERSTFVGNSLIISGMLSEFSKNPQEILNKCKSKIEEVIQEEKDKIKSLKFVISTGAEYLQSFRNKNEELSANSVHLNTVLSLQIALHGLIFLIIDRLSTITSKYENQERPSFLALNRMLDSYYWILANFRSEKVWLDFKNYDEFYFPREQQDARTNFDKTVKSATMIKTDYEQNQWFKETIGKSFSRQVLEKFRPEVDWPTLENNVEMLVEEVAKNCAKIHGRLTPDLKKHNLNYIGCLYALRRALSKFKQKIANRKNKSTSAPTWKKFITEVSALKPKDKEDARKLLNSKIGESNVALTAFFSVVVVLIILNIIWNLLNKH